MGKSLRSMSKQERKEAISRRLKNVTLGLGYWAAIDATNKPGNIAKESLKQD